LITNLHHHTCFVKVSAGSRQIFENIHKIINVCVARKGRFILGWARATCFAPCAVMVGGGGEKRDCFALLLLVLVVLLLLLLLLWAFSIWWVFCVCLP
jgi:hypothetical protein